jgi:hypothetical protein
MRSAFKTAATVFSHNIDAEMAFDSIEAKCQVVYSFGQCKELVSVDSRCLIEAPLMSFEFWEHFIRMDNMSARRSVYRVCWQVMKIILVNTYCKYGTKYSTSRPTLPKKGPAGLLVL